MKCSECTEFIEREQTCNKCKEKNNSAIGFWVRHENESVQLDIKDGDCLYYEKAGVEKITHKLKTLPKYFNAVMTGEKTFEVRKDDRNFQVGDYLLLQLYYDGFTYKDTLKRKVTYILGRNEEEKQFVKEGYVILGIK